MRIHEALRTLGWCSALVSSIAACDDPKSSGPAKSSETTASSATVTASAAPPPDKLPEVLVDAQGAYLGGERANLSLADGPKKLASLIARYPVTGKPATVVALRNARTADVATTVAAIGDAGAETVTIRTQDRSLKDQTITVMPDKKAAKIPDCSMIAMIMKDRSTSTWPIRGQTAIKYSKGMAGPDISSTLDGMKKGIASCASTTVLFSGDDGVEWGLTFDLGTRIATADPPFKTTTYVLPRDVPTAGLKVKLGE